LATQTLNVTSIQSVTPTMLSTFERCPHQFHRRYIEKSTPPQPFSPDLACGNAAHAVLHGVFEVYQRTGGYPINLRERVEDTLPSAPYLNGAFWALDVERVLTWVKWALGSIDEAARVVLVERWLEYVFPGNGDQSPFRLRHCVDIVLEHEDGTIEHRDWKSGERAAVDALQTVTDRILVRHAFPNHPRILSSTGFLATRMVQIDELTREQVSTEWQRLKRMAAQISREKEWRPVSNALCPFCPFYQQWCLLYRSPDGNPDGSTEWLEGAP
jgi:CRISPR/Cas system-associated exonuclease Cas4 (RecB family)